MSFLNPQDIILPYGVTATPVAFVDGGYQQLNVTSATIVTLTVPSFAVAAAVTYEDAALTADVVARFGYNTTVSSTYGNPVTHLMYFEIYGLTALALFGIIAKTGLSGKLNVQYYR